MYLIRLYPYSPYPHGYILLQSFLAIAPNRHSYKPNSLLDLQDSDPRYFRPNKCYYRLPFEHDSDTDSDAEHEEWPHMDFGHPKVGKFGNDGLIYESKKIFKFCFENQRRFFNVSIRWSAALFLLTE